MDTEKFLMCFLRAYLIINAYLSGDFVLNG